MAVTIKNFINIKAKVSENLEDKFNKFELAMSDLQTKISTDVERGRDINGNEFVKYSDSYRKWREKKSYRVHPPNLRVTGTMMNSMNLRIDRLKEKITGIIGLADDSRKVLGNLKKRKFFGLTEESLNKIKKRIGE